MSFIAKRVVSPESLATLRNLHWVSYFSWSGLFTLFIWPYLVSRTTELGVTNRRLIVKRGILNIDWQEMPLRMLEEVEVDQSLLGRLMNYGFLSIKGGGGGRIDFGPVSDPYGVLNEVQVSAERASMKSQ